MEEYFKIGKFAATHGVKGELVLQHVLGKKTTLKGLQALFVEEKKDSFLPYFVTGVTARSETENLLTLEDIGNREQAMKLVKKEVWMNTADFKKFSRSNTPVSLLGFTLYNEKVAVGEITEVVEMPHQLLCKVNYKGAEALIPLHEDTLQKVDRRNRKVIAILPEGLLDIYAG